MKKTYSASWQEFLRAVQAASAAMLAFKEAWDRGEDKRRG
jgi:hypothetical protein